jgi:hypothetical protein
MDIIDMAVIVFLIGYQMRPKPALPLVPLGINRVLGGLAGLLKFFRLYQYPLKNVL